MKRVIVLIIILVMSTGCALLPKENNSKDEEYQRIKGMNEFELGKYEQSLASYLKAYEMNKNNIDTLKGLGIVYIKLDDFENGKKYFDKILEKDPKNLFTLQNLSTYYYNTENYSMAKKYIDMIDIIDNNFYVIKLKAYIDYKLGDYESAYVEFSKALEKKEDFLGYDFYRTYIEVLKKTDKNHMIYDFVQNLYLNYSDRTMAVVLFAEYLKEIEVYEKGIEVLKTYGIKNSFEPIVIYQIADIYYLAEEYNNAEKYITLLSEKESYQKNILELKIKIYKKVGRGDEAATLEKILNANKRDDD